MSSSRRLIGLAAAVLLMASACGKSNAPSTTSAGQAGATTTKATTGGAASDSIVVGTTDSLQNSFDPAQAYDYFGSEVVFNSAETLVTFAPNETKVSPLLAKALPKISDDALTYTFDLRDGVKFTDGTTMDSAAVKFSLERAKAFGDKDSESAGFLLAGIKSIDTPSPTQVVITLDKPNVTFLSRLAYSVASIISPAAYKNNVLSGSEDEKTAVTKYKSDTIVATGRYKLKAYKEKESLEFEANPDYWGDKPKTKRVLVRLYDKSSALKLALQNHEVDAAFRTLQPDETAFFKSQTGFKVVEGEGPGIRYLVFQTTTKPWDNPDMRRAVAAAVNRQPVIDEILKGTAKPLPSMIPTSFDTFEPKWTQLYGDGTAKDKVDSYLKAAGVPEGQKVDVDFWFSPTHYGDTEAGVAQVMARALEATGRFNVKISNVEWAEYGKKRKAGEMPVFLMGWYPDYLDEDDYLEPFANPKLFDPAKWEDQKMLDLVAQQQKEVDASKRKTVIKDAQSYMADQAPYVPVFQISQFASTSDKVSGVTLDASQIFRYWLLEKKG